MLLSDQVAMGLNYRMKLQVQMVRGQLSCFFACAKFLHGITAMFFCSNCFCICVLCVVIMYVIIIINV